MPIPSRLITAVLLTAVLISAAASDIAGRSPLKPSQRPTSSPPALPPSNSGVGINFERPRYWLSDWPFIDEFKRAGGWFTQCDASMPQCTGFSAGESPWDTREQPKLELDADGWIKRLPKSSDTNAKFRTVAALLYQGNGGAHVAGRYVVLYDGMGSIDYGGAGRKLVAESRPGRDIVDMTNTTEGGLIIRVRQIEEGNHLRNIRVIPPGGVCVHDPRAYVSDETKCGAHDFRSLEELQKTQVFHPRFLADIVGFRTLRFMPWANTNESTLATWDARPKMGDALWSSERGVPLEAMLALAKTAGADPWVNVTPYVDDDYVRRLARLARESVKAPFLFYFEYGNEPWNGSFPFNVAGNWYEKKARAKWPDATNSALDLRMTWYAYRSVQLCGIVKAEFGDDASRVRCVANGMAASAQVSAWLLECRLAQGELGAPCARRFDTLAIAPYFGHYLGLPAVASEVQAWAREPDGLDKLFRELSGRDAEGHTIPAPLFSATGKTPRAGSVDEVKAWIVASKKLADKHGLPLIAYEGGQGLTAQQGGPVEAMFLAANRDPRMGQLLERHLDDWKEAGGQLYVLFAYAKRPGRGGYWGLKEHQLDEAAPKWKAAKAARDEPCWWNGCRR